MKSSLIKLTVLIIIFFFFLFPSLLFAFPYLPPDQIKVLSEYSVYNNKIEKRLWYIKSLQNAEGKNLISFYLDQNVTSTICSLEINKDFSVIKLIENNEFKTEMLSENGLFIKPGFPAPCNILPVYDKTEGKEYDVKTNVGGRNFKKKYKIIRNYISREQAEKDNLLHIKTDLFAEFVMVSVVDVSGREVVKQLWPEGYYWWVYEETANRRSWLED